MGEMASQITSLTIVYSTVYSGADKRKHQSSTSLTFVRGIHRSPVNSPYKKASNAENVSIWWCHHAPAFTACQAGWGINTFNLICQSQPLTESQDHVYGKKRVQWYIANQNTDIKEWLSLWQKEWLGGSKDACPSRIWSFCFSILDPVIGNWYKGTQQNKTYKRMVGLWYIERLGLKLHVLCESKVSVLRY